MIIKDHYGNERSCSINPNGEVLVWMREEWGWSDWLLSVKDGLMDARWIFTGGPSFATSMAVRRATDLDRLGRALEEL